MVNPLVSFKLRTQASLLNLFACVRLAKEHCKASVVVLARHSDPAGGPDQLRYVNVVFGPAVRAFVRCSFRVLDVDAAHPNKTRKDLRYICVVMHTTNDKRLCLCFHLGSRDSRT